MRSLQNWVRSVQDAGLPHTILISKEKNLDILALIFLLVLKNIKKEELL